MLFGQPFAGSYQCWGAFEEARDERGESSPQFSRPTSSATAGSPAQTRIGSLARLRALRRHLVAHLPFHHSASAVTGRFDIIVDMVVAGDVSISTTSSSFPDRESLAKSSVAKPSW